MGRVAEELLPELYENLTTAKIPTNRMPDLGGLSAVNQMPSSALLQTAKGAQKFFDYDAWQNALNKINESSTTNRPQYLKPPKYFRDMSWLQQLFNSLNNIEDDDDNLPLESLL